MNGAEWGRAMIWRTWRHPHFVPIAAEVLYCGEG